MFDARLRRLLCFEVHDVSERVHQSESFMQVARFGQINDIGL